MRIFVFFLIIAFTFSCKSNKTKYSKQYVGNTKKMTLHENDFNITYYINDTISTLHISHQECTECLDAYADSGIVYIPDSVAQKMLKYNKERGSFPCSGRDLKLIGKGEIDEVLFGNQDNFMNKWHDKFLIRGKVIDLIDGGLLFYVNDYVKTYDE